MLDFAASPSEWKHKSAFIDPFIAGTFGSGTICRDPAPECCIAIHRSFSCLSPEYEDGEKEGS